MLSYHGVFPNVLKRSDLTTVILLMITMRNKRRSVSLYIMDDVLILMSY